MKIGKFAGPRVREVRPVGADGLPVGWPEDHGIVTAGPQVLVAVKGKARPWNAATGESLGPALSYPAG
jgi:hypothetical protein